MKVKPQSRRTSEKSARESGADAPPVDRFFIGDCLPVLAELTAQYGAFADLVYLDPPFNSARLYNHAFTGAKRTLPQKVAFADTWQWTEATKKDFHEFTEKESPNEAAAEFLSAMRALLEKRDPSTLAYLTYMTRRLARIRAAMKPAASVYLHCDPTACHYLKLAMDAVFGRALFVMDVIWHRYNKIPDRRLPWRKYHDNILVYRATPAAVIKNVLRGTGKMVRRRKMKKVGGRIVNMNEFVEYEQQEVMTNSVMRIADIAQGKSPEKMGYQTQKPLELLRRIIEASSNKGDIVLDPFCGCGTTMEAAHELGRRFIGIDVARSAAQVIARRMKERRGFELIVGDKTPTTLRGWGRILPDDIGRVDAPVWARFQYDAIAAIPKAEQVEGAIQKTAQQGADGGIDGIIHLERPKTRARASVIIQVKRKKQPTMTDVADTLLAVENNGAFMGLLITLNPPTAGMRERAERAKNRFNGEFYPKVAILTYDEIKSGKFAEAIPYAYAVDPELGKQPALNLSSQGAK